MQDEIDEVLRFFTLPSASKNKLLNGQCKFVINSGILFKVNRVLDVIIYDQADILPEGKRKKLQLLLNFLSNIPRLTVSQRSAESFENVINLSKFKRLRHLELSRVCLQLVVGLDALKTQLETFVCNRCTKYEDVICKKKELEWPDLRCFDLRYMKLDQTSTRFFISKPWIQILDLSFNRLTTIEGLEHLDHLKFVNFGFNHLDKIPTFSKDAEKKLKTIILKNNYISSLSGIEKFTGVMVLDINSNLISNKSECLYLYRLKALEYLNFMNNPFSAIQHANTFIAASLSKEIDREKFVLNGRFLSNVERALVGRRFGMCIHWEHARPLAADIPDQQPSTSTAGVAPPMSKYRRPGKRISKPRDVIIEDSPDLVVNPEVEAPTLSGIVQEEAPSTPLPAPPIDQESANIKEIELMEQFSKMEIRTEKGYGVSPKSPDPGIYSNEPTLLNIDPVSFGSPDRDNKIRKMLISATVHAEADSGQTDMLNAPSNLDDPFVNQTVVEVKEEENQKQSEDHLEESQEQSEGSAPIGSCNSKDSILESDLIVNLDANDDKKITDIENASSENTFSHALDNNQNVKGDNEAEDDSEAANESENEINTNQTDESEEELSDIEDEIFWQVQRVHKTTEETRNILLVLLDNELKERRPDTGHTITRWPLNKILSCSKIKMDPIIVELEFDVLAKDKRSRTYIMEYPDAQVLLKKVYSMLESRPLSSLNQKTYECIKCGSFFVRNMPSAFKTRDSLVNCTVCSSTLVIEAEEPKLPDPQPPQLPAISHSSSLSSIGNGNLMADETASMKWKSTCSAASLEPNASLDRRASTFSRYESDIEVISNPSQSSIEVLGEHSRSVTPRRRISVEEKPLNITHPHQLSTVMEVQSPFANLTESSSSGSLTESVVTAYEALNNNRKTIIPEGTLAEEDMSTADESDLNPDTFEEERPISVWRKESDIYSFSDFTDVDPRIKLYLYQTLFQDDNEALLLLVKCHLWRTGGSDYDGCVVFSTSKVYFLSHSRTNFKEDTCNWLTIFDTYDKKEVKDIIPLISQQGVRVQIKHISYLILLMDQERTNSLLKHIRGFLTDIKLQNSVSSSTELSLQQAILSASSMDKSSDPSVNSFTICQSITIIVDEVEEEILRLGSLVLTSGEFHLLPGDLTWLTTSSVPSVVISQNISSLIEVEKGKNTVNLHFLDEKKAVEEVWRLKLASETQVSYIIDSIRTPWEQMYSESLDITIRS